MLVMKIVLVGLNLNILRFKMSFRIWCQNKWLEHLEEHDNWGLPRPEYDSNSYFKKYKWWLKREYRHSRGQSE